MYIILNRTNNTKLTYKGSFPLNYLEELLENDMETMQHLEE